MAAPIQDVIKKLVDSQSAKIDITTVYRETIRLNCVYKESHSPNFFLVFPPKKLPDNIDLSHHCPVSITHGDSSITLTAEILYTKGDRMLELSAHKIVTPESLREFFRVDARVPTTVRFDPVSPDSKIAPWEISGSTLNISGSGLLAILPKEPPSKQKLTISTEFIPNRPPLLCDCHVIRSKRIPKGRYQVSFQFDNISQKIKDDLISFCLKKQRDQLRDKIRTAG